MKKCYSSRQYIIYSRFNAICGSLCGSIMILLGVFTSVILTENESPTWCGILLILGISIITYTILFVVFLNRKYDVNENGITISYANRYTMFYPWESIQFACVAITHRSGTGTTQDVVIWCTTKKRSCHPPTELRRRISWEYDFFHCNSVITIEFSEERYQEFAHYYQECIPDYR